MLSHGQHLPSLAELMGQERSLGEAGLGCWLQVHLLPLHHSSAGTTMDPKADVSGFP